jgi:hypothetical protein
MVAGMSFFGHLSVREFFGSLPEINDKLPSSFFLPVYSLVLRPFLSSFEKAMFYAAAAGANFDFRHPVLQ